MEDTVIIDTGNNLYAGLNAELVEKYDINVEDAYHGKAMTNVGLYSGYSLPADTVKICSMTSRDYDRKNGCKKVFF
jgi:hypothetical protein